MRRAARVVVARLIHRQLAAAWAAWRARTKAILGAHRLLGTIVRGSAQRIFDAWW